MKKAVKALIICIAVCALVVLMGCFYTVREDQYAVVMQFGKIIKVENTAGLKFKTPFIQSCTYVPKSVQIYDIPSSDVITKDKKSMIADDYILFRVTDPTRFVQTLNGSLSGAQDRTSVAAYNATKNVISSMTQDEVIASRGEVLTDKITLEANSDIGSYGLEIVETQIKALDLPEDNKAAVYERMISERNNIAAAYEAQGKADAQKIMNETDKTVAIMKAEAEKQAAILEAEGESEYMRTLTQAYDTQEKADFYNFIRSLDALKKSFSGGNKTLILDKDSELVRILYGMGF